MAKILFCHPMFLSKSPDEQASGSPYFPLGLLYLAGYVRQMGHQVAMFDGTFAADETVFAAVLEQEQPDVVGISALMPTRDTALLLAGMAQAHGTTVILGGPDPTRVPEQYAAHRAVDVVVHHEGEQTITALLDLLDDKGEITTAVLPTILGIAFHNGSEVVVNPVRPPIDNLDTLPLPARDLIDVDRYLNVWQQLNGYASLTISTTRGCPYGCDWCAEAVHGQGYRQRSPESVAAEVKLLKETYQIDRLRVVDDVDGIDRAWLDSWADSAVELDAVIPFEALNDLSRQDIPMLDVRDSL